MDYEIIHFSDAQQILEDKDMLNDLNNTCEYIYDAMAGFSYSREILRSALEDMNWREDTTTLNILEGRRYRYKGVKGEIAMDGNFSSYEYLHTGLFRLQVGYDKGNIVSGVLLLPSQRSEKSPYGNTLDMLKTEMEMLYPTISLPVSICLFNLEETFQ
jgi:hypothetical protein